MTLELYLRESEKFTVGTGHTIRSVLGNSKILIDRTPQGEELGLISLVSDRRLQLSQINSFILEGAIDKGARATGAAPALDNPSGSVPELRTQNNTLEHTDRHGGNCTLSICVRSPIWFHIPDKQLLPDGVLPCFVVVRCLSFAMVLTLLSSVHVAIQWPSCIVFRFEATMFPWDHYKWDSTMLEALATKSYKLRIDMVLHRQLLIRKTVSILYKTLGLTQPSLDPLTPVPEEWLSVPFLVASRAAKAALTPSLIIAWSWAFVTVVVVAAVGSVVVVTGVDLCLQCVNARSASKAWSTLEYAEQMIICARCQSWRRASMGLVVLHSVQQKNSLQPPHTRSGSGGIDKQWNVHCYGSQVHTPGVWALLRNIVGQPPRKDPQMEYSKIVPQSEQTYR
ncbi:hypothetical protein Tco_1144588 [Tanacetum coccineum]